MGVSVAPPGPADPVAATPSLAAFGSVVGPAGGGTIAQIVAPPAGVYELLIYNGLSGTITVAEQDNLRLVVNAVTIVTLPIDAVADTTANSPPLRLIVRNAAGVAAAYTTLLVATLIG